MIQIDLTPKRRAALALLQKTGIAPNSYAPLAVILLWRVGIDCPPPHMARFGSVATAMGGSFGLAIALGIWAFAHTHASALRGELWLAISAGLGVAFGLGMASYYALARAKHKLPLWKDFQPPLDA
ncbi:DUF6404 family protein [Uliginosibacterium gangwonense]|uniref:DUF6404 family protein n=1 Tax=Uliginosibacterium gangwonense TaxID=392736 RepID=UPI00036DAAA3|nr:DUF6404 family protein [Uliginosibacterium gangwonense]